MNNALFIVCDSMH